MYSCRKAGRANEEAIPYLLLVDSTAKDFLLPFLFNEQAIRFLNHSSREVNHPRNIFYNLLFHRMNSIRKYKVGDQKEVLSLFRLNTPKSFHPSEEKQLQNYLENEAQHYFVAEDSGRIVAAGGFNLGFDSGKAARISWDMVNPEFQRMGIGKELTLFRIEEIKKDLSVNKIVVRTTPQAEKFYQKIGFQKVRFEKDFWAPGFDLCEVVMKV